MSYAFGIVPGICEVGQQIYNAFDEIDDEIEAFNWYLFPLKMRKMLPIILMVSQQPVQVDCFGSIFVLREAFKKVSSVR